MIFVFVIILMQRLHYDHLITLKIMYKQKVLCDPRKYCKGQRKTTWNSFWSFRICVGWALEGRCDLRYHAFQNILAWQLWLEMTITSRPTVRRKVFLVLHFPTKVFCLYCEYFNLERNWSIHKAAVRIGIGNMEKVYVFVCNDYVYTNSLAA